MKHQVRVHRPTLYGSNVPCRVAGSAAFQVIRAEGGLVEVSFTSWIVGFGGGPSRVATVTLDDSAPGPSQVAACRTRIEKKSYRPSTLVSRQPPPPQGSNCLSYKACYALSGRE